MLLHHTRCQRFQFDFKEIVEYVAEKCLNAQIIIIDFWSDEKYEMKKDVVEEINAERLDVGWIDMSGTRENSVSAK